MKNKEENSQDFCPNYVQEFGLCMNCGNPWEMLRCCAQVIKPMMVTVGGL